MDFINEKISILYGSQTGNAQDVAERIWRESKKYYFASYVKPLDEYNVLDLVNEKCVIFVCSTTGQGEEPDNMKSFWKFLLRKNLPSTSLVNINYAVLGLGDSSYAKFNFAAKRLNKRLEQLGGRRFMPLGLGDDQHDLGYDAAVDQWLTELWQKLSLIYRLPNEITPLEDYDKLTVKWVVSTRELSSAEPLSKPEKSIYYAVKNPREFTVTVQENTRTTSEKHFQDVRLIKLKTNGEEYKPGDVVVLRPKNSPEAIQEFLEILKSNGVDISPTTLFLVTQRTSEISVPPPLLHEVSFEDLCTEYFDLTAIPRRSVFGILAQITDSEIEKEKCIEFTTPEGQQELYNYVNRPRRNITEILQDFPHATKNLTPELLFEILSPMKPREFSIASSYKYHENEIHILVAVVRYKTKLVKERLGLCSNYLADLKQGQKLSAWLKNGSFKFFDETETPIIMVGPGTGLAPFRNFIFERVQQNTADSKNLILFFGCRGQNADFHCKEELEALRKNNQLNLICAFSRDQDCKVYVQHKILENKEIIWDALKHSKASIFIAGNSKNMPQQVREAFVEVCQRCGKLDKEEAEKFITVMERQDRYQTETWS